MNRLQRSICMGATLGAIVAFSTDLIYSPRKAYQYDLNHDGKMDIITESVIGRREAFVTAYDGSLQEYNQYYRFRLNNIEGKIESSDGSTKEEAQSLKLGIEDEYITIKETLKSNNNWLPWNMKD